MRNVAAQGQGQTPLDVPFSRLCDARGDHGAPCVAPTGHPGAHFDGRGFFPQPVVPTPTIAALAAKFTERLAVLERVRPILSDAIGDARGEEAVVAVTLLGLRIINAILTDK
jgi:hypothetical protein